MWPFKRRTRRTVPPCGNGHAAMDQLTLAQARLRESLERSIEVDRLAAEVRRALGGRRT